MKLDDLGQIATAWYRASNPTPEQEQLAEERLAICSTCPERVRSHMFDWWKCNACGCPLHKKIFSPKPGIDACPKSLWPR